MTMCLICKILQLQEWARYPLPAPQEWEWRIYKSPKMSLKAPTRTQILGLNRNLEMTPTTTKPRVVQPASQPRRRYPKTLHPHVKGWLPAYQGEEAPQEVCPIHARQEVCRYIVSYC